LERWGKNACRAWLYAEDDGDSLFLKVLRPVLPDDVVAPAQLDHEESLLDYLEGRLHELLRLEAYSYARWQSSMTVHRWLLAIGVAPGQPFYAELRYRYSPAFCRGGEMCDPDESLDINIVHIQPWTVEHVLGAWCSWWMSNTHFPDNLHFPR
jgi:hypothetical protein